VLNPTFLLFYKIILTSSLLIYMVSVSDVSSRDGLETYQRLVSVSSRPRAVSVSSRNSLAMSRSRLGLGAERLGLGLGLGLEGLVHIPDSAMDKTVNVVQNLLSAVGIEAPIDRGFNDVTNSGRTVMK
jgi:hypothetical protein